MEEQKNPAMGHREKDSVEGSFLLLGGVCMNIFDCICVCLCVCLCVCVLHGPSLFSLHMDSVKLKRQMRLCSAGTSSSQSRVAIVFLGLLFSSLVFSDSRIGKP